MAGERERLLRGQAVAIAALVWRMVGEHAPGSDELADYIRFGDFPPAAEESIEAYNPQLLQDIQDRGIFH